MDKSKPHSAHIRRYIITGIFTVIPIWVTWLVFHFVYVQLSNLGMPWVKAFLRAIDFYVPNISKWLLEPWFQSLIAVLITLIALYLLGWATNRVIGKRLLALVDWFMRRIPLVQTVYGSVKKLISVLQQKPEGVQRVVLINFPSPEMKTVGFVTRLLQDADTGQELAAVYVPTTPNPTSGYLEIVPLEQLISTDWSIDEAMTFVVSGGAVAPDRINYTKSVESKTDLNIKK
ncbi:MAG: DUF502 domain-containing protein [Gammaproteobacteria bacterium]|nr:MAG: DUF502 domain-containing protein [Gammaproteobacteria bacterium]